MWKRICILLLFLTVGGGIYAIFNYEVTPHRGPDGKIDYLTVHPRTGLPWDSAPQRPSALIRVATFNLSSFDQRKLGNRVVSDALIKVIPQYDFIAIQDVRAGSQGVLRELVDLLEKSGRRYEFAVASNVELEEVQQYSAFLFNAETIEIDVSDGAKAHLVEDPQDRFRHQPLVAYFRVRGPDQRETFTFQLVNVHIDPDRAMTEGDLLDDVYRAVRARRPAEDDVILLGDFGVAPDTKGWQKTPKFVASVTGMPTSYLSSQPIDNILLDRRATCEFTGVSDVTDLIRDFELTAEEARDVSDHLPVWAEFSPYEGGRVGRVAGFGEPELQ